MACVQMCERGKRIVSRSGLPWHARTLVVGVLCMVATIIGVVAIPSLMVSRSASAGSPALVCTDPMGGGMDDKGEWHSPLLHYVDSDVPNRVVTLEEALGNTTGFVTYHGEGEAKDHHFVAPKGDPDWKQDKSTTAAQDQAAFKSASSKLGAVRGFGACTVDGIIATLANINMDLANAITALSQFFASQAFNPNLVCSDENTGDCMDLVRIIAGSDNHGGLISSFGESIYFPMLALFAVFMGARFIRHMVRFQVRRMLHELLWFCTIMAIGVIVVLKPTMVVHGTTNAVNVLNACVVGSASGVNCFDGGKSGKIDYSEGTSTKVCYAEAVDGGIGENMELATNSISCQIWKAFIIEPESQAQFGTSFESLDTFDKHNSELLKAVQAAGYKPEDFCVNLGTDKSLDDQKDGTLNLNQGDHKVCNLMAYQMYVRAKALSDKDPGFIDDNSKPDFRWYRLIATTANSSMWNSWAPSMTNSMTKLAMSQLAIVTTILGSILIIVMSLTAIMYMMGAVVLLAFLPFFLLAGLDNGRGRRLLFGWLEKFLSALGKYILAGLFVIITTAFLGGILGSSSSVPLNFLLVIIVTAALWMYRKELLDLFGRVNMGGQQVSNALQDRVRNRGRSMRRGAMALAGAGVAGRMSPDGPGFFKGVKEAARSRTIAHGGIAGAIAQGRRNAHTNRRFVADRAHDLVRRAKDKASRIKVTVRRVKSARRREIDRINNVLSSLYKNMGKNKKNLGAIDQDRDMTAKNLEELAGVQKAVYDKTLQDLSKAHKRRARRDGATDESRRMDAEYEKYKSLMGQKRALDLTVKQKIAMGASEKELSDLLRQKKAMDKKVNDQYQSLDKRDFIDRERQFKGFLVNNGMNKKLVDLYDSECQEMKQLTGERKRVADKMAMDEQDIRRLESDKTRHGDVIRQADAAERQADADLQGLNRFSDTLDEVRNKRSNKQQIHKKDYQKIVDAAQSTGAESILHRYGGGLEDLENDRESVANSDPYGADEWGEPVECDESLSRIHRRAQHDQWTPQHRSRHKVEIPHPEEMWRHSTPSPESTLDQEGPAPQPQHSRPNPVQPRGPKILPHRPPRPWGGRSADRDHHER